MENLGRKLEIFVIVTGIAFIGIIFAFRQNTVLAPTTNPNITLTDQDSNLPILGLDQQVPTSIIEYQGQDGKNALELLKAGHRVEAEQYSFGDLVTSIDGITPDAKHFWAMYVNGNFSQVGSSAYVTKSTDTIKWQIDEITSN